MKCIRCNRNIRTTAEERNFFRGMGYYTPMYWVRDQGLNASTCEAEGLNPNDSEHFLCFDCYYDLLDKQREEYMKNYDGPIKIKGSFKESKKIKEMARTIKDYNDYRGWTDGIKKQAWDLFIRDMDRIEAEVEYGHQDKGEIAHLNGLTFELNYCAGGDHNYSIDVINDEEGTIQDQWQGKTVAEFKEDMEDLYNKYSCKANGNYPSEYCSFEDFLKSEVGDNCVEDFKKWCVDNNKDCRKKKTRYSWQCIYDDYTWDRGFGLDLDDLKESIGKRLAGVTGYNTINAKTFLKMLEEEEDVDIEDFKQFIADECNIYEEDYKTTKMGGYHWMGLYDWYQEERGLGEYSKENIKESRMNNDHIEIIELRNELIEILRDEGFRKIMPTGSGKPTPFTFIVRDTPNYGTIIEISLEGKYDDEAIAIFDRNTAISGDQLYQLTTYENFVDDGGASNIWWVGKSKEEFEKDERDFLNTLFSHRKVTESKKKLNESEEKHIKGSEDSAGVNPFYYFKTSLDKGDKTLIFDNLGYYYELDEDMFPKVEFHQLRSGFWDVYFSAPSFRNSEAEPEIINRKIKGISKNAACVLYGMLICGHGDREDSHKIAYDFEKGNLAALKMVPKAMYTSGYGIEDWMADWDDIIKWNWPTYSKWCGWCGNFTKLRNLLLNLK